MVSGIERRGHPRARKEAAYRVIHTPFSVQLAGEGKLKGHQRSWGPIVRGPRYARRDVQIAPRAFGMADLKSTLLVPVLSLRHGHGRPQAGRALMAGVWTTPLGGAWPVSGARRSPPMTGMGRAAHHAAYRHSRRRGRCPGRWPPIARTLCPLPAERLVPRAPDPRFLMARSDEGYPDATPIASEPLAEGMYWQAVPEHHILTVDGDKPAPLASL